MYVHPTIDAALAEQHRRDLMSQASACRLARAARQGNFRNPARRPLAVKALGAAAAMAAMAATAFLVTSAGTGPASPAHDSSVVRFAGHHFDKASQSSVLAVHFRASTRSADGQATGRWA